MQNDVLSARLQHDILKALSVFHPHPPSGRQYYSCFADVSEFQMTENISVLIKRRMISRLAIKKHGEDVNLRLAYLRLTQYGFDYAISRCFTIE
ncbi:hypothetical protein ACQRKX_003564 [Enterobacter cloacae]